MMIFERDIAIDLGTTNIRAVRLEHRRGKTDKHHAVARLLHGFEFVFFHNKDFFLH